MKKPIPEKAYYTFFEAGVVVKGILTLGELALGSLFYFASTATLNNIFYYLLGNEATEQPRDLIWGYAIQQFQGIVGPNQSFWAFILLSHGIVKIFLVWGLLKHKLWAYPTSAVIFALFVAYQIYSLFFIPSLLLAVLTAFDIILIFLILHEYRQKKIAGKKIASL